MSVVKRLAVAAGALAAVAGAVAVVLRATPWPSVLVIRKAFERGAVSNTAQLRRHPPARAVEVTTGIPYTHAGAPTFDLVLPAGHPRDEALPVVVWVHGGAWISGFAADNVPYLEHLAAAGYAAVALDYTVAPEARYPTAVRQLDEALGHLTEHAAELGIDPERIVLAGDSAGAQLASQLAALTVDPEYARALGLRASLRPEQLRGVVLQCGVYDIAAMADVHGIAGWGFKAALWALTGEKDWSHSGAASTMSTIDVIGRTPESTDGDDSEHPIAPFPPVFISGGNGDALTSIQSLPMSERMRAVGIDVTTLFWPADHEPPLPHEYHLHLDRPEAHDALRQTLDFVRRVTRRTTE
ncbi:alpha/beta hydrolase [Herbiconiux sp. KACC 21604]|uniref:alpha/beta hydrolase n=1 Tax=unclassified Herbiconiux TaxID=2618217 RepID=UPI0014931B7B|nr:alpha/beta hydrolase [Herbiconiux sp. SALV-R1]QJU52890.1 alpha/beta hydrolase [Herbiconiux sp. SALV-R1]WPO87810.1 alpha/beta hydrolase [Herbiconiux sp. KACC 21604]